MTPSHLLPVQTLTFLSCTALLAGSLVAGPAFAEDTEQAASAYGRGILVAQAGGQGKGQEFGPEANPGEMYKRTRGRSSRGSKGLTMRRVNGKAAGKPISSMRGAKAISRGRMAGMKEIPKTGLYLVDLDHVPPGLEDDLKRDGYRLGADGTLTRGGKPVALFIHGETYAVKPEKDVGRKPGGGGGGALLPVDLMDDPILGFAKEAVNLAGRAIAEFGDAAKSLLVTEARAASPFPWRCASWYWRWEYNGGFCRDYKVWTHAYAWGAGPGGTCGDPKPLTRIQYISTYASIGSRSDWDYHYNADQSHSYARWDIGCFWPAHGGGSGYHYAYMRDGSAWWYVTHSW